MRRSIGKRKPNRAPTVYAFNPNHSWQERHDKRLALAVCHQERLEGWLGKNGLRLHKTADDGRWEFLKGFQRLAVWWPSKATFWEEGKISTARHCHDYVQVQHELAILLGLRRHGPPAKKSGKIPGRGNAGQRKFTRDHRRRVAELEDRESWEH